MPHATERDIPLPDSILRALWRAVEVYVFVVLIVKDRRVPAWNGAIPDARPPADVSAPSPFRTLLARQ
ncbi:hypothetical protein [Subtercola boreus]|uniref:Uncharacterized protein n=2 Tax=Subtercola boreus TaxID=120213 RepID=A0A3E0WCC8_9MICO|nr:hypothetical protein [Subtercola boreus]RFA21025.1 hypothetical protein B7R24_06350 [Subtercola boreus]RFA21409.1 hypothetical protein B7R23_06295 [Subtercola boreus]RFA27380.1 hypothetical protein B7R25_06420 [Subtercola boreus]